MSPAATTPARGATRSEEGRIRALEAQIEALKQRKARRQQRRDPALRHMKAAVHSIDRALAASSDHATRQALGEARSMLAACLALVGTVPASGNGTLVPHPRRAPSLTAPVAEETLLAYVRSNPGQRGEQIAQALGTDTGTIRPGMKRLIQAGKVRTAGQARATSYSPSDSLWSLSVK